MGFAIRLTAFLKRDLKLELSYPLSAGLHVFGMLAHLLTFFYIGRLLPAGGSPWLEAVRFGNVALRRARS